MDQKKSLSESESRGGFAGVLSGGLDDGVYICSLRDLLAMFETEFDLKFDEEERFV